MKAESYIKKRKKILELFTILKKLHLKEELDEIKNDLHKAWREGDIEVIKIFISEKIENSTNTLKFKIDETNQTATLFKVENKNEKVIIPRIFEHESTEYLITSIYWYL